MPDSNFLTLLDPLASHEDFPPTEMAWESPNGLLAMGGDLSPERLINAYRSGIFPWFSDGEPIYWWSPDPRAVIFPNKIRVTRSLRKSIRNKDYRIDFDRDFPAVVSACAAPRATQPGTWITQDMYDAYVQLHKLGIAHSVEVRNKNDELVGGLYGVASGCVFSGESMFSRERDTSKIALIALAYHLSQWGYLAIDCQIESTHLVSMGAENINRTDYIKLLKQSYQGKSDWELDKSANLSSWKPE